MLSHQELEGIFSRAVNISLLRDAYVSQNGRHASVFSPLVAKKRLSVLRELRSYSQCLDLIEAHERERSATYGRLVFSRLEYNWLAPHPPLSLLAPCFIWVPPSHDGQLINDAHAVMPRDAADAYFRRWEYLLRPGLLQRVSADFLAIAGPEDFLAFVIAEANISVATLAAPMLLACCGKAGRCFSKVCRPVPLFAVHARRHEPFGDYKPRAPDGRGATMVVRGKYPMESAASWRHAAALGCPGSSYRLRLTPSALAHPQRVDSAPQQRPVDACGFREPAGYPPGFVRRPWSGVWKRDFHRFLTAVEVVVTVPSPRLRRVTPSVAGGLVVGMLPAHADNGSGAPWFCPSSPSGFWPRGSGPRSVVSAAGFCAETAERDEGDCEAGHQGGWDVGWNSKRRILTLQDCIDACRRCGRCNFVSVSFRPFHEECSWFRRCPRFPYSLLRADETGPDMVTVNVRLMGRQTDSTLAAQQRAGSDADATEDADIDVADAAKARQMVSMLRQELGLVESHMQKFMRQFQRKHGRAPTSDDVKSARYARERQLVSRHSRLRHSLWQWRQALGGDSFVLR